VEEKKELQDQLNKKLEEAEDEVKDVNDRIG
jgi:hypothetical protein